jgi:hypothetical protein
MMRAALTTYLVLATVFSSFAQVATIESTSNVLKEKLASIYITRRLQNHVPFYSPVYIPTNAISPIVLSPIKINLMNQTEAHWNGNFKFDAWGKDRYPLYMQPNRYDWMHKVRENEKR